MSVCLHAYIHVNDEDDDDDDDDDDCVASHGMAWHDEYAWMKAD